MGCDYYIQSELVILYYDDKGVLSNTKTNINLEKGYVVSVPEEDSDDDDETQTNKWKIELDKRIRKNTYQKILYEDDKWFKESYQKKYLHYLNILYPRMVKLVKIYKDVSAWERK